MRATPRHRYSALHPFTALWVVALLALASTSCAEGADETPLGEVVLPATVCAGGSTLFGIDVSKWQGNIDWARVKAAGVKYAFIRVSDGIATIDEKFVPNWVGAGAQGIPRGVYQFFRPHRDPIAQADIVIDHLLEHGLGELPPVIDVEATNDQTPETIARNVGLWIDRVEAALGVTPIIYTGRYFWNDNVRSNAYSRYPLWIAHYTSSACPNIPDAWGRWAFWQYSSTGRVDGIAGDVDMNRFNGTTSDLLALAGDAICRDEPNYQGCSGTSLEVCSAERRLTLIPCNGGTVCAKKVMSAGYMCMDPRCSGTVGEFGQLCAGERSRAECAAGAYTVLPCGGNEVCDDGECVPEPGPVEPQPEPGPESVETPPETSPEAVEPVDPVEPVEAWPEVVEPGPEVEVSEVVEEGARVLGVGRSVAGRAISPGQGCGAGGAGGLVFPLLGLFGLWSLRGMVGVSGRVRA